MPLFLLYRSDEHSFILQHLKKGTNLKNRKRGTELKKKDEIEVKIESLGFGGKGFTKVDG